MNNLIDNNSIILKDDLIENMCILDSNILEEYTESWKYNRNLNSDKINEIKLIIKDKLILDTVLHFFYINNDTKLICFDGNHRREALILLNKIDNINIKVCCYVYKNINPNNIDKEIIDKFKIINQMTPIPDIYSDILDNLQDSNLQSKAVIIENSFQEYKIKFKPFYSINSKCRRPNFNDTTFKDLCNKFNFNSKESLDKYLIELNESNKIKKVSESILNKCKAYNFYMFI
jgi:hypothetical protein